MARQSASQPKVYPQQQIALVGKSLKEMDCCRKRSWQEIKFEM